MPLHIARFMARLNSAIRRLTALMLFTGALLGAWACSWTTAEADVADRPTRRQLIRNSRQHKQWVWVYCPQDTAREAEYRSLLEAALRTVDAEVRLYSCQDLPDSLLAAHPLAVFGASRPGWQHRLHGWMPVSFPSSGGFHFYGQDFKQPEDLLKVMYFPSPWAANWPIHLWYANTDAALLGALREQAYAGWDNFWSSWGYEVKRGDDIAMLGHFNDTTWQVDPANHFAFEARPDMPYEGPRLRLWSHQCQAPRDTLLQLVLEAEARYERIKAFTGAGLDQRLDWHLYPSLESKGLRLRNTQPAHAVPDKKAVHLVLNNHFRGDYEGEDNLALLRLWLGAPATTSLERGLATYFAARWGKGRGWAYWAARLHQSDNLPPLSDLLDNETFEAESALVMAPAAAAWVAYLLESWGREAFLQRYASWSAADLSAAERRRLEAGWQAWLGQMATAGPAQAAPSGNAYRKGFTFAHEGYSIYNGYGGGQARASLERLRSSGANALAIVPYSYMRSARQATPIPVVREAGSETDESVLHAAYTARELGFYCLLKPQIWVRGGWPGDVQMPDSAAWDQFFDYYYRWMRHYALLAEMHGLEALCVGTELTQATLGHPDRWRSMIRRWRGLYSGTLTYAANWGPEFEGIAFWDELDYCGLNGYYPLSKADAPTDAELRQGAEAFLDKAEAVSRRFQRPVWLTEIGYRSVEKPWTGPHEEAKNRPVNTGHQQRCFEALFAALADESAWFRGMFWWKWPSQLSHNEDNGAGFNPINKPAEATLRKYFQPQEE